MSLSSKPLENFDCKKLYSFEDHEFKLNENQESLNLESIKEDNVLNAPNAPSPIQNNTMQEMDSEFLKEYEDAISDRDKKISELMHEIERLHHNKQEDTQFSNGNNHISNEIIQFSKENGQFLKENGHFANENNPKEVKQRIKMNFDLLLKLTKEIEIINKGKTTMEESPKFSASSALNYEKTDVISVLLEALNSFEQEFLSFFETKADFGNNFELNQLKNKKNEMENVIDNLKKEDIEMKFELQNAIQQIQELEIENIGLNDQISTLSNQMNNLKGIQNKINEKEEISYEKTKKLEKELKEKEEELICLKEKNNVDIGALKEKFNVILEKKQNEIADLNKSKQNIHQYEVKIQDLLKEINKKNSLIGQLNLKNQGLNDKIHTIKRDFYRLFYEKISNFKIEMTFLKKNFQEFTTQIMNELKHNLTSIVRKFLEEKKALEIENETLILNQTTELQRKIKKGKITIKGLKKELMIANEFKYQTPPEETINLIQSKLISEIEERKSLYTRDFMKETSLNNKLEEQNVYVNKEISLINNNMNSLEQDYKTFLNLYSQTLRENTSKNVQNESKMLTYIEKIYRKIEDNTKKDEKINNLIAKLGDKSHRIEEEKFLKLNKTDIEKENSFDIQKFEQENLLLTRELDKLKKKLGMKDNELKQKNENINRLEKEKKLMTNEYKDLQVELHLKNTHYQINLNKMKNLNVQTELDHKISPLSSSDILTKRMSFHRISPVSSNDIQMKRMSFHQVTPLVEKEMNTPKDTLNSIRKIFQNHKI